MNQFWQQISALLLGLSVPIFALDHHAEMPQFKLRGVDGSVFDSALGIGSPLLAVVFLSNHCPASQMFQGELIMLANEYRSKGFRLIAISPNDPEAIPPDELAYSDLGDSLPEMKIRAKELKYPFPFLYDGETQQTAKMFGVKVTPHVYLFDKNRKLRYSGRIGDPKNPRVQERQELRQALKALVNGDEPPIVRGRAFGSSIKWAKNREFVIKMHERYSRETVLLREVDKRTLEFIRRNKAAWPKMIYVWSISDKTKREDLLQLSAIHKIYRKRGLEWITVCIENNTQKEDVYKLLKETQSSGRNFMAHGSDISPLADLRAEKGNRITPYIALVEPGGAISHRSTDGLLPLELKRYILSTLAETPQEKND